MPFPSYGSQLPPRPRRWNVRLDPALRISDRRSAEAAGAAPRRPRRRPREPFAESLLYPFRDGPGWVLLVLMPLFLWLMSVPVFDIIAAIAPKGEFTSLALLVVPIATPLIVSFGMVLGYILLFLGHVLVASSLGEVDHPAWPAWDSMHILEGLGRLFWAALVGLVLGGVPAVVYWVNCGDIDTLDEVVLSELLAVGLGYAQMALAASLLHDRLLEANPITALRAIRRIGWGYLYPCLVSTIAVLFSGVVLDVVLFHAVSLVAAAVGMWAFWVFTLYLAMVAARILGQTYYRHAEDLGWCRGRPRWASSSRTGRIYANS